MRCVAGCKSNIGRVRENNQDAVVLRTFEKRGDNLLFWQYVMELAG